MPMMVALNDDVIRHCFLRISMTVCFWACAFCEASFSEGKRRDVEEASRGCCLNPTQERLSNGETGKVTCSPVLMEALLQSPLWGHDGSTRAPRKQVRGPSHFCPTSKSATHACVA